MPRHLAYALLAALGACAAPTASSNSPELSNEPLPPGLRHAEHTSTWLSALGDQDGMKQWSVLIQISEPFIAVVGAESGGSEEVSVYAQRLLEAIHQGWESGAVQRSAESIEAFLHAQPIPKGMNLTAKARRLEDGRPKAGLDLVQRDGSTG